MDRVSTYALFGIPDAAATALVLVALSITLAPWFGGLELGPLKVPKVTDKPARFMRFATPFVFLAAVAGFFPAWTEDQQSPIINQLDELALRWLEDHFGGTTWEGGHSWGEVIFDASGREARYTNAPGRVGGSIELLRREAGGSGYVMFNGVWIQEDGKKGDLNLLVAGYANEAQVRWGPELSISDDWRKVTNQ